MLLAIDLGSTWCKAGYFDQNGSLLASGRAYSRFGLGYGSSQVESDRIWAALAHAVRAAGAELVSRGYEASPLAVALSCRGGTGLWLDDQMTAIAVPAVETAGASFAQNEITKVYQWPVWGPSGPFAFSYAPAIIGRLLWLRRHEPAICDRIDRVGALHDWIVYRLTGMWLTDPATSTGGHPWPADAVALTGLSPDAFPPIIPQEQIAGGLTDAAAADLGLEPGVPVVTGCHDGVAANIGCGIVYPGDVCITLGSNLVVRAVTGDRLPGCFGYPIVKGGWAWVRGVHGVASQIDAVVDALDGGGLPVAPERHLTLTALAEQVDPNTLALRMPTLPRGAEDESARQAREALSAGFSHAEVYRATLEGAAYSVAGLIDTARQDGAVCDRFVVTGAAAGNKLLVRMLSAIMHAPIEIGEQEAGLLGAAVLAAVGAGVFSIVETAVEMMVKRGCTVNASPNEVAVYAQRQVDFNAMTGAAPGDETRRRLTF